MIVINIEIPLAVVDKKNGCIFVSVEQFVVMSAKSKLRSVWIAEGYSIKCAIHLSPLLIKKSNIEVSIRSNNRRLPLVVLKVLL